MTSVRLGKNIALLTAAAFILAACSSKDTPPPEDTAPAAPVEAMDDGKPDMPETPEMTAEQLDMEEWGGATASGLPVYAGTDRVFFAYDSSDLTDHARATLGKQAAWLMHYPRTRATVEGHCDERGTREYNLALGDRRATAVKNYLIALGVPSSRLKTISYGKERPAEPGNYSQNRRGVLRVQ